MVALLEQMLALHKARQPAARTPHEQSVLAAQIAATDRQMALCARPAIDRLVCDLHGLIEVVAECCTRRNRRQPTAKTSI